MEMTSSYVVLQQISSAVVYSKKTEKRNGKLSTENAQASRGILTPYLHSHLLGSNQL